MLYKNLGAVMVLYHPDVNLVKLNALNLSKQVQSLYLVDNTPDVENLEFVNLCKEVENVYYLPQKKNVGIAEAQNIGIFNVFQSLKSEYVLLFDQDSEPDSFMIDNLMAAYLELKKNNTVKISAIGTIMVNKDNNKVYEDRNLKNGSTYGTLIKKTEIMSSGSLISKEAIEEVGMMESALFIDGVDHEWCWRANRMGYSCFVSEKALLLHKLGEGDRKFLGITLKISSPKRTFYQFRNFIILARRSYVPINWKILNFCKYFIKIFYFPFFISPRIQYLKNIFLGIKEGVKLSFKKSV